MTNPFDAEDGTFFALVNGEGQHSLWPRFIDIPAGWTVVHEGDRRGCLAFIEETWTDMRPRSLVEAMRQSGEAPAAGAGTDE